MIEGGKGRKGSGRGKRGREYMREGGRGRKGSGRGKRKRIHEGGKGSSLGKE